jgi:hypothetical protein
MTGHVATGNVAGTRPLAGFLVAACWSQHGQIDRSCMAPSCLHEQRRQTLPHPRISSRHEPAVGTLPLVTTSSIQTAVVRIADAILVVAGGRPPGLRPPALNKTAPRCALLMEFMTQRRGRNCACTSAEAGGAEVQWICQSIPGRNGSAVAVLRPDCLADRGIVGAWCEESGSVRAGARGELTRMPGMRPVESAARRVMRNASPRLTLGVTAR